MLRSRSSDATRWPRRKRRPRRPRGAARPRLRRPRAARAGADPCQRRRRRRRPQSYQRLEFLGDRVLGLAVAEMLYARLSRRRRGRPVAPPRRARAQARPAPTSPTAWASARTSRSAGEAPSGGRAQPRDPRRRLRGDDRRRVPRRRLCGAQAVVERAFARAPASAPRSRRATRRPRCRNGRWRAGLPTPTYAVVEQSGRDHAPALPDRRRSSRRTGLRSRPSGRRGLVAQARGGAGRGAEAMLVARGRCASARQRRSLTGPARTAGAEADDALRLRRPDRRAERRQVDAAQRARRHQGLDRLAQGADDAHARARHRDRGQAQIIFVDTPGIFAPKRRLDRAMVTLRLGRGGRRRRGLPPRRRAQRASTRRTRRSSDKLAGARASRRSWCSTRSI